MIQCGSHLFYVYTNCVFVTNDLLLHQLFDSHHWQKISHKTWKWENLHKWKVTLLRWLHTINSTKFGIGFQSNQSEAVHRYFPRTPQDRCLPYQFQLVLQLTLSSNETRCVEWLQIRNIFQKCAQFFKCFSRESVKFYKLPFTYVFLSSSSTGIQHEFTFWLEIHVVRVVGIQVQRPLI